MLARGELSSLADMLMQRFKAVELAVQEGSWGTAARLELLPLHNVGLTSLAEKRVASKAELLQIKLEESRKKQKS